MQYSDSDIKVATAEQDGTVKIYGIMDEKTSIRPFIRKEQYNNYGQARLRTSEFVENERNTRNRKR